jgi:hypothetical protein
LVFGTDHSYYHQNKLATPFLNTDLSKRVFSQTKEYETIIDYFLDIIGKTVKKLVVEKTASKYTMEIEDRATSAWEVYEAVKTRESRAAKIQYGVDAWQQYKQKIGFVPLS